MHIFLRLLPVFSEAYFISLYFLSITPLTNLLVLSFLFFCSKTEAQISFEATSVKRKDCLIFFWRFSEAKTTTSHKISYWFTRCQMVSVLFLFFSFSSGALADVVLHCFFSKPSSLSPTLRGFFVKTIVASSFSLLRGFSSFEKLHCNKKGWRFWRRWRHWWARE